VKRLFLAAAKIAGSPLLKETSEVVFGITPPRHHLTLVLCPQQAQAILGKRLVLLLAEMPRSNRQGRREPSACVVAGDRERAELVLQVGSPALGSVMTPIPTVGDDHRDVALAKRLSCWPRRRSCRLEKSFETRLCSSVRPCWIANR